MKVAIALLALVAVAAAGVYDAKPVYSASTHKEVYDAKPTYSAPAHKEVYAYAPAYYDFAWAVKDDHYYYDMGQKEHRSGDNTNGEFWANWPGGRQSRNYEVHGQKYGGYGH